MAYMDDRMGVGSSRIDSPLLTVQRYGYRLPGMGYAGMGIVGVDDAAIASGIGTAMQNEQVQQFMKDTMSKLTGGLYDDISSSMKDETMFPKVSATYVTFSQDIEGLLGATPGSKEAYRINFRLGELAAVLNPKVKQYGYAYAGPSNNKVNDSGKEGSDFRTATGNTGTVTGIGHRWEASGGEEFLTGGAATGRAGRRLEVEWSVCETLYRIRECLKAIPTVAARRAVFAGMLVKYFGGGDKVLQGMAFLGAPAEVPQTIVDVLAQRYTAASREGSIGAKPGRKGSGGGGGKDGGGGTVPPAGDSGSGGLIAIVAAAAGLYLLTKG